MPGVRRIRRRCPVVEVGECGEPILQHPPAPAAPTVPEHHGGPNGHEEHDGDRCQRDEVQPVGDDRGDGRADQVAADGAAAGVAGQRHVGGRVERLPAGEREPHLHPCVRIAGADLPDAGHPVTLPGDVPGRQPGRHPLTAQHDHECRCDLLAESELGLEQEVVDRICPVGWNRGVEVVPRVRRQPLLVGEDRVVGGRGAKRGGEVDGTSGRGSRELEERVDLGGAGRFAVAAEHLAEVTLGPQRLSGDLDPFRHHGVHRSGCQRHVRTQGTVRPGPQRTVEDDLRRSGRGVDQVGEVGLDEVGLDELLDADARRAATGRVAERRRDLDDRPVGPLPDLGRHRPGPTVELGERLAAPERRLRCADPHDDLVTEVSANAGVQRLGEAGVSDDATVERSPRAGPVVGSCRRRSVGPGEGPG